MGILQPQAFALTDTQLRKKFDEIWAAINGLTAKTNNLQTQIDNISLTPGEDGLNCWDLDGDGTKDASEDTNNDGQWNALDCKGPKGDNGDDGLAGLDCWDLDGDGVKDAGEDINNDGDWSGLDCRGLASHNLAPVVDAGDDQSKVGLIESGGCVFGICYGAYLLACEFDISGNVQDDEFTGYLAHKWGPASQTSIFSSVDDLNTHVTIAVLSPVPIVGDFGLPVTLTADDGIIEVSDDALLTCQLPQ